MPLWCTKYCMGIRDDGTTKWFQVHSIWVLWATFYLQTQKLFIQNADFDYIGQDFNWPCTYSALDLDQWSALSAYSAAHFKRESEQRKIRVCVSILLYTVVTKHTNQIFSSFIFSFDMLCTRCSNKCRKSRLEQTIQSIICARPIEILAYVVKVCILNIKFLCLQVECCLKDP